MIELATKAMPGLQSPPMKRVVLVTNHYLESDHKAGFHWLADAFWRAGWQVLFFTESVSWLSYLRGNDRCKYPLYAERNRLRHVREGLASYVWLTPFHPISLRNGALNRLTSPLLSLYGRFSIGDAAPEIAQADLFVFDSDHGLFLFDRFQRMNPRARFVYRVSDDIRMMRHHPIVEAQEDRVAERFDLVSVPTARMFERFRRLDRAHVQPHGLDKALFDQAHASPYASHGPNVVYVGKNQFDADFVRRAVRLFPDWAFHVIGAVNGLMEAPNLTCYGERAFAELVPYVKHADIGLQALAYTPGAEVFTDSLKMHQYTYCRLPIVAPSFLRQARQHVYYYEPGDDASICAALEAARRHDRASIATESILSWDELASTLAGDDSIRLRSAS
jgi:2-beta-glucuronyltransferase